ncbi:hypothetical protein PIB30_060669 [Stylosanthes scabra]|uniref:Uncharacterized protein n=1 Tax=Stylosanthes scabra TaxID=79078 RepID=A0ABU6YI46_9FABA|nr:hypothetical protein [Stylosanthes scabra]
MKWNSVRRRPEGVYHVQHEVVYHFRGQDEVKENRYRSIVDILKQNAVVNPSFPFETLRLKSISVLQQADRIDEDGMFGTKLQEPTLPEPANHILSGDAKTPNTVRNTKELLVFQEEAIAIKKGIVPKEPPHLPYPIMANKMWKAKITDKCIIKLLRKVEVTLPLFEIIRQVPKYAKFLKKI